MENIKELRDELVTVFDQLMDKTLTAKEAKEIINTAGKIIASCKIEVDYAKLNKKQKNIDFLEYENEVG